ncbi:hypothetical protein [Rhizobium sp. FKL33]|uniref:hypothetical protein n=1 Tax=Rhizobium sp. FKL33 TaxID=2562307 RepID=UPI0010C11515|nr:hypothetical protein [Rhizobium sp. FKL33]
MAVIISDTSSSIKSGRRSAFRRDIGTLPQNPEKENNVWRFRLVGVETFKIKEDFEIQHFLSAI